MPNQYGDGPVELPWHAEAEEMWNIGVTTSAIAEKFGITKSTIIGLANRRNWPSRKASSSSSSSTLFTRLDAIHVKFDAVMEELNRGKAGYRAEQQPPVGRLRRSGPHPDRDPLGSRTLRLCGILLVASAPPEVIALLLHR